MGRNVLVISTVEHADDVLRSHVGDAETIKVVVPVVRQGALDWLANDEKAFGHAEGVAERTADQLSGETVEATAGEADVGLAIRDALATFPADEIVIAVRPEEQEGYVESSATDTAPKHHIDGVPVRYVVIPDSLLGGAAAPAAPIRRTAHPVDDARGDQATAAVPRIEPQFPRHRVIEPTGERQSRGHTPPPPRPRDEQIENIRRRLPGSPRADQQPSPARLVGQEARVHARPRPERGAQEPAAHHALA